MTSLIVKDALRKWLRRRNKSWSRKKPNTKRDRTKRSNLWAGELGGCHRKVMLRMKGLSSTVTTSDRSLDYMRFGVILEDDTKKAMLDIYGESDVKCQMRLTDGIWTGKPDFVLYHGTPNPIIVEHKVTGEKSWWKEGTIPRKGHIGQLCLYGHLYSKVYGIVPRLILFYRSWGHYAEFDIEVKGEVILISGYIDDVAELRQMAYDIHGERLELEDALRQFEANEVLPPRMKSKSRGCKFFGKPSCNYYYHCWDK